MSLEKTNADFLQTEEVQGQSVEENRNLGVSPEDAILLGWSEEELTEQEEPQEEKEEEEPEAAVETEAEEEEKEAEEAERNIPDDLKKILELVNKDETLKSKGLEVKVSQFEPHELKALLQKGLRFYQATEELARQREELSRKEQLLEEALKRLGTEGSAKGSKESSEAIGDIPEDLLEITDEDSPDTVVLKKALKSVVSKVKELSSAQEQQVVSKQQEQLLKQIEALRVDYPLANVEEVLAVHFLSGGKVPIEKVMEASQKYYGSPEFVKRVFEAVPTVKKQVEEEIIKSFLTKQEKAKKATPATKVVGSSAKPKVSAPDKSMITFENASSFLEKFLAEASRINKEE